MLHLVRGEYVRVSVTVRGTEGTSRHLSVWGQTLVSRGGGVGESGSPSPRRDVTTLDAGCRIRDKGPRKIFDPVLE